MYLIVISFFIYCVFALDKLINKTCTKFKGRLETGKSDDQKIHKASVDYYIHGFLIRELVYCYKNSTNEQFLFHGGGQVV